MKEQLDKAAGYSGRSQSQEAEFRLESSFRSQAVAIEGLELAFGSELAGFVLIIARASRNIGAAFDFIAGTGAAEPSAWAHSQVAFDQVMLAIAQIGAALRPEADASLFDELSEMTEFTEHLGEREAKRVLEAARGDLPNNIPQLEDLRKFGATARELLGPAVASRLNRQLSEKGK